MAVVDSSRLDQRAEELVDPDAVGEMRILLPVLVVSDT
jgi:hypothetical protein